MNYIDPKEIEKLKQLAIDSIGIKADLFIGTTSLTPINFQEEIDKFLKSDTYNPKFKYKPKKLRNYEKDLSKLKTRADQIKIPEDLKEHVLEFLDDQTNLYKTKSSIGKKDFAANANKLFNWGTDRLDILLTNTPNVEFTIYEKHKMESANTIKKRFEKILRKYEIDNFKVNIDNFSTHIINVGFHNVNIGSAIKRHQCNVDRLIIHEIETHVLQMENIHRQNNPLVWFTKYGNLNLYSEGLAVFNEILTRKITPDAFATYYFRIKAVRLLHKSFRDIYEALRKDLPEKKALVMTYRVKRGLADTSMPGGFPKDASYLLGFHEIETLINEGYDKKLLFATKSPVLSSLLSKHNLIDTNNLLLPDFYK